MIQKSGRKLGRILVLTGARQTGKTTLAKEAFPAIPYISMDDPTVRPAFTRMSAPEWLERYPIAVIDEVQKTPGVIDTLKAVHDRSTEARYVLLGSSQILLLSRVKETLAGRVALEELWPLTLPEMETDAWEEPVSFSRFLHWMCDDPKKEFPLTVPALDAAWGKQCRLFQSYLTLGGMPSLHDPELTDEERRDWLRDYQRTYLERDVADLAALHDLEPFVLAQRIIADRTGKTVNYSEVAKDAGISVPTAKRFIRYLELSYQVISLKPFYRNTTKRLTKMPKLHFVDPGILNAVLKRQGEPTGEAFESAIVAELWKQIRNADLNAELYHLRTYDGREVDVLIELEMGFIAVEIKKSFHVSVSDARSMTELETVLDKPLIASFVLSNDVDARLLRPRCYALPAAYALGANSR